MTPGRISCLQPNVSPYDVGDRSGCHQHTKISSTYLKSQTSKNGYHHLVIIITCLQSNIGVINNATKKLTSRNSSWF